LGSWVGAELLAQQPADYKQRFRERLAAVEEMQQRYERISENNPENTGARRLVADMQAVKEAADAYQAGAGSPQQLRQKAQTARQEAQRYPTDNAQKTARRLKALIELTQALPPSFTEGASSAQQPSSSDSLRASTTGVQREKVSSKAGRGKADQPAAPSSPGPGSTGEQDDTLIYALAAVYLIAILGLGFALSKYQRKQISTLENQIYALASRVENLEDAQGGNEAYESSRVSEVKKRLEGVEKNIADYLEQMDQRLQEIEAVQERLNNGARSQNDRLQQLEQQLGELTALPERLRMLETRQGISSSSTGKAHPPASQATEMEQVQSLRNSLAALEPQSGIQPLKKRIEEVLPTVDKALASGNLSDLDFVLLAQILQLAYVAGYNESLTQAYTELREQATGLGLTIEDRMQGRMSFSSFYADNVAFEDYVGREEFQAASYPDPESVKAEVENSPLLHEAVKNTVLLTLHPAIIAQERGAKRALQKGVYIVQG
jgi:ABC-type transporter Mla subunit MlaD